MTVISSLIAISTQCLSTKVPSSVSFELIRKICLLYTDHERCYDRDFLEHVRGSMHCTLRAVHTNLDKVTVEFEITHQAFFQPASKAFAFNSFPLLKEDGSLFELCLEPGTFFYSDF